MKSPPRWADTASLAGEMGSMKNLGHPFVHPLLDITCNPPLVFCTADNNNHQMNCAFYFYTPALDQCLPENLTNACNQNNEWERINPSGTREVAHAPGWRSWIDPWYHMIPQALPGVRVTSGYPECGLLKKKKKERRGARVVEQW